MLYKDKIKDLRDLYEINQEKIAKVLGIARGLYAQYETEYAIIPITHLISLCNYFNASLDYIFSFTDIKQYKNINKIDNKKAGLRLKEWRKNNKITQDKLAIVLNTNRSVIANYERGRTLISTPFLYTICKEYKISADYLLGRIDKPKYFK